jgi:hypothetical protein
MSILPTLRPRGGFVVAIVACLVACESPDAVTPATFTVTPKTVELRVGESVLLVATASEPLENDPIWTSPDTSRVVVDVLGRVAARAQGTADVVATATVGAQTLSDTARVSVISGCPSAPSIGGLFVTGTATLVRPDFVTGSIDVGWGGACSGTSTVQRVDLVVVDSLSIERTVAQATLPQPIPASWSAPRLTFNSAAKASSGLPLFPAGLYVLKVVWTFTNSAAGTSAAAIPIRIRNP